MYRLSDSTLLTRVDDETILLDSAGGSYFGINGSGTKMLDAILDAQDFETVVARMESEYAVDTAIIRKDLAAFIASLVKRGLLIVSS